MTGIVLAIAFLFGVILHDSGVGWVVGVPLLVGAALAAFVVGSWSYRLVIVLALMLTLLGAWRAQADSPTTGPLTVRLSSTDRSLDATIIGIPRMATTRTFATVAVNGASDRRIDVSLPLIPPVESGDLIRFWAPESWDTSTAGEIELPFSANGDDLFIPAFEIERTSTSTVQRVRTRFNAFLTSSIERNVPEPAGALTLGILNGDDSAMTDSTRAAFRTAGMSQITAVSGWNVAIVAGFIAIFTRRLARNSLATLLAGAIIVWSYAFLVGMGPSVLRAAGMATVFLVARWRGRPGDLLTSLLLTISAIVALTPAIRFDIGFQLSVVATLGIIVFFEQAGELPSWQSALALPFVAELAVAPLVLHHFGMYSLLSPMANLVTGPLVELVMAGGVVTVAAAFIHPTAATVPGMFTWVPARIIIAVAERTAGVRETAGTTVTLSWTWTFVSYLSLIAAYLIWSQQKVLRRRVSRARRTENAI